MRRRTAIAVLALLAGLALALLGRMAAPGVLDPLAGLFLALAAILGLGLLPFWRRLAFPPRMPGLFARPGRGGRWCTVCGQAAPASAPCPRCRTESRRLRRQRLRLQRKQRSGTQERKP